MVGAGAANAANIPIDFGNSATIDLNTLYQGSYYPTQGGSTVTINGVNFTLPTCVNCVAATSHTPENGNLGVQNSGPGVIGHPGVIGNVGDTDQPASLTFQFSPIYGATTVYALVNSMFGQAGSTVGSLLFVRESGLGFQYNLIEGTNVRDHYEGDFNNEIDESNLLGTALYKDGELRLDALKIDLPPEFLTDPLVKIVFTTLGDQDAGLPFWAAAMTVTTNEAPDVVPVPAAWSLMLGGLGGIWVTLRRGRVRRSRPVQSA